MNAFTQVDYKNYKYRGSVLHVFTMTDTTPPFRRLLYRGTAVYTCDKLSQLDVVHMEERMMYCLHFAFGKVTRASRTKMVHSLSKNTVWECCDSVARDTLGPLVHHFLQLEQPLPEAPEEILRSLFDEGPTRTIVRRSDPSIATTRI
ncbi:MAG: hypothetical protein PHS79_00080 [Patescibacteria group bacterium]|nr:hypothetical protein [Patescibacteria group bacterium]